MRNRGKRLGFVAALFAVLLLVPATVKWGDGSSVLGAVVTGNSLCAQACSPGPLCDGCVPMTFEVCGHAIHITLAENFVCGDPGLGCW